MIAPGSRKQKEKDRLPGKIPDIAQPFFM